MGGFFGVASKTDCVFDLFFGTDYHSHLGTKKGGLAVFGKNGFKKSIHNIENSPFRTKFEHDVEELSGNLGIGCISDFEPQPLIVRSKLGKFAISTVGRINNIEKLANLAFEEGSTHFFEMSGGDINPTELVAALMSRQNSIPEGIRYVQKLVDGSLSMLVLTPEGIYAARDLYGRTPIVIGKKKGAFCACFECFSYLNLGYTDYKELGPAEIDFITADAVETVYEPLDQMKMCAFMWVYYGYPSSSYEGMNVEQMRYNCGKLLASHDKEMDLDVDCVAGVPDSGIAHAIGYANESGIPFSRPFIKYTPTWPRSFMPHKQSQRSLIAKMKLIAVDSLIRDKKLLIIDDSIVRGTQLKETTDFLYKSGAKAVHIRTACPPVMFSCKYLNFSSSTSDMDLITHRTIAKLEGEKYLEKMPLYCDPDTKEYATMVEEIRKELKFTSLKYHRLDDMLKATGVSPCKLCTYCWNGKE